MAGLFALLFRRNPEAAKAPYATCVRRLRKSFVLKFRKTGKLHRDPLINRPFEGDHEARKLFQPRPAPGVEFRRVQVETNVAVGTAETQREPFLPLAERLEAADADFIIAPQIRFKGQAGEQAIFFVRDPSGNALEFKSFASGEMIFAR